MWDFLESDFFTFAVPNTAFGILSAFASSVLIEGPSSPVTNPPKMQILRRLPQVLAFNVVNLLVFTLANQRTPESVEEDRINKPWRPIPQGRITIERTRRVMLAAIPATVALNHALGVERQGVLILLLTWLYNDLGGGDEAFLREIIISIAYGLYNSGSLTVALGPEYYALSSRGMAWVAVISGVILTTMQVQDLKDQEGDKTRGRKTIALFLGEHISRASLAFFVCFWSCVCAHFWVLELAHLALLAIIAAVLVTRLLFARLSFEGNARAWRFWCIWHSSLYILPLLAARGSKKDHINAT
uniref:Digeranylgeranylglyceryl phosphate synthase protein n=1 Tax=Nodulisporium sp. TaxID=1897413 RepID=A0A2R4QF14_9PEZI|nr:digeranylgeranylglyceryl phosphate synthase protein [Nodulisporium sp.]